MAEGSGEASMEYESMEWAVMCQPVQFEEAIKIINLMIATATEEFCSKVHCAYKNIQ